MTAESTQTLLRLAASGNSNAREQLFARLHPRLTAWASTRLPAGARQLCDTSDLVQKVLTATDRRLASIDLERTGDIYRYLRTGILNAIRNEIDRVSRRPPVGELSEIVPDPGPAPLEQLITAEAMAQYDDALATLDPEQQALVIMRFELGLPFSEIADTLGAATPDAIRMRTRRAVKALCAAMKQRDG